MFALKSLILPGLAADKAEDYTTAIEGTEVREGSERMIIHVFPYAIIT